MDISKLLEKAREAAERRNYDYAIELYQQACKLSPDSVEGRRELRAVENRVFKERGISFGAKLKLGVHLTKAKTMQTTRKYDNAIEACEEVLKLDPGNMSAQMMLGMTARDAGYKQCAAATFEDIVAARGGGNTKVHVEACRQLAYLLEESGRIQEALERWADVNKATPGGDREATQKARDLSAKDMSHKIETSTSGAQSGSMARRFAKDTTQLKRLEDESKQIRTEEDLETAIKYSIEDIKKRPEDPRLYGKLGSLYQRKGAYEQAKKAFQDAIAKDATNPTWRFKMDDLEIWRLGNDLSEAQKRVKAGDTALRETVQQRWQELLDMKLKSYIEREKNYTTDSTIKFQLGNVYFEVAELRKDHLLYDEAIKRFQTTFRDPKFRVQSGLRMGLAFGRKAQYELALKRFEETLGTLELRDERWKELMYAMADTLELAGRRDEALKNFLQIYEVDVAFKDVSLRVTKLQKQG